MMASPPINWLTARNFSAAKFRSANCALKNMAVAVKQYEEAVSTDDLARAAAFEAIALRELDAEIDHMLGEGREVGMNVRGLNHGAAQPVPTLL